MVSKYSWNSTSTGKTPDQIVPAEHDKNGRTTYQNFVVQFNNALQIALLRVLKLCLTRAEIRTGFS